MPYSIRNRLTALKKDRGEYIKPADVNSLYQAVIKQGTPAYRRPTPSPARTCRANRTIPPSLIGIAQ